MEAREGIAPYKHWIIDDYWPALTKERMHDAMQHQWQVFYDNDTERNKRTSCNFLMMLPELRTAFIKLWHEETVAELRKLTGIEGLKNDPTNHGAGLHLSTDGSYLQTHLDYSKHSTIAGWERRLNALLFLHDKWDNGWGGQLLLADPDGKPVVEIDPKPGRLVLFECSDLSYHGVRVICGKDAVRLSAAVYYLALARPNTTRTRAMFFPNRSHGGVPHEVAAK